MDIEDNYDSRKITKKIRLKIVTNRGLQFITAVRPEASISDLANRALSVYLQLAGDGLAPSTRKQLTVSAVKQGVFYMPKSECVSSLLLSDDQVEVIIIKAKPKYPQQLFNISLSSRPQQVSRPLAVEAVFSQVPPVQRALELEVLSEVELEPQPKSKVSDSSKRQKKKDKKKQKWDKKKCEEGEKVEKKQEEKHEVEKVKIQKQHPKEAEFKDSILQSMPRKKIKLDQEPHIKSPDKPAFMMVHSPKITFHQDPQKIDSPNILLPSDPLRKKSTDNSLFRLEAQPRKASEDHEKKFFGEKIISPVQSLKSPMIGSKTPVQGGGHHHGNELSKGKEKEDFSNFSLSRKGAEEKRGEVKNRKQHEQSFVPVQNKVETKEIIGSSIHSKVQFQNKQEKVEPEREVKKHISQQTKGGVEKLSAKPVKNLVIVQPGSESDSQENKKIANQPYQSSRFKQLAEIKSKIQSFMINSDEDA